MTTKYRKENVKTKTVDFQRKDWDLYQFSKTFNFTCWVMEELRKKKEKQDEANDQMQQG